MEAVSAAAKLSGNLEEKKGKIQQEGDTAAYGNQLKIPLQSPENMHRIQARKKNNTKVEKRLDAPLWWIVGCGISDLVLFHKVWDTQQ
ncbi:Os04g0673201 [Oryza sativa Japonica Group]|uniref:Os04g0673201 protein n=1 Tax=Oryza sativa subsp. japonica TaxID=39947 RepID=A0A0P0WGA3_ORYSJ|nr:Os04g0673201 [Oryza sativa Japonica Group]